MKKNALVTMVLIASAPLAVGQVQQNTNTRQDVANEEEQNETFVDATGGRIVIGDDDSSDDDSNAYREKQRDPLPNDDGDDTYIDENDREEHDASAASSAFTEVSGRVAPGVDPATGDNTFGELQGRQDVVAGESEQPSHFGELQGREDVAGNGGGSTLPDTFGELQDRQSIGNDGGDDDRDGPFGGLQGRDDVAASSAPSGTQGIQPPTAQRLYRGMLIGGNDDDQSDAGTFREQQDRQSVGNGGGNVLPSIFGELQDRQSVGDDGGDDDRGDNPFGGLQRPKEVEASSAPSGTQGTQPPTVQRLQRGILIGGDDDMDDVAFFGDLQGRQSIGDGNDDDDGGNTVGEQHHAAAGNAQSSMQELAGLDRHHYGPGGLLYEAPPKPAEADRDDQIVISDEPSADEEEDDGLDEVEDYVDIVVTGRAGSSYALLAVLERDAPAVLVAAGNLFDDSPSGSLHVYLPRTDSSELPTVILVPLGS